MATTGPVIVWHAHHLCGSPLEFLTESFSGRMRTIDLEKTGYESKEQIARRKKLFKRFKGTIGDLPLWVQKLYKSQRALYYEDSFRLGASRVVLALHKEQCGCGWTQQQRDIFKYTP